MIITVGHTLRIIILIMLAGFELKAQLYNTKYNFKHLNVQSGLTQNIVYHFLQDSRGYMWIGTHNGLNLYDGTRVINFMPDEKKPGSIGGKFITSLQEDSSQQIWIGNETGIDMYNRATNSFFHFGVDRPDGTKENTYCVALGFVSADELWILETKTRSVRSLNIRTKRTSFIAGINATHAQLYKGSDQSVHIWSAYDKGTIHQVYRNSKLISQQIYFAGKDGSRGAPVLEVIHILQQNDSTVWLSTNKGLVKLNPVLDKYSIYDQWQNQSVNELRYSSLSSKDQLWVATGPAGIYIFDIKTKRFIENYRNDKLNLFSICSDNVVSLYFDKMENFWCGSYGNGASYTHTGNKYFSSHVSKNDVQSWNGNNYIHWFGADPADNIWCTFDNIPGFLILDSNLTIKKYTVPVFENGAIFNQSMYKLLFESPTEAWCTTNKGLYRYNLNTNKLQFVKYKLLNGEVQGSIWIKDILRLQDGSILFSTFWGLYHIVKDGRKFVISPVLFLKPGAFMGVGVLYQDEAGIVYAKSLVDSLYILKPAAHRKGFELIKEMRFAPFVNQFYSEKNDSLIYLATSEGVYHINKNNFQIQKEIFIDKTPFLSISSVFKRDKSFWVFGGKGLYHFDKRNKEARTFTVEDGLPANEFTLSGLVVTANGRCIAGSSNGLVSFYYQQQPDSIYPARPQLTSILINDTAFTTIINPDETKKINLTFRQNTFSFNFSPIVFQHTAEYSFEYKLEGYDEDWIKSGDINYTRYSKIPPGNYVFNLRILDPAGKISPYTKILEIQIAEAWWQTATFKITAAIFVILLSWLLLKWYFNMKISKQKREFEKQQLVEKERTRIATDMHDDLGAGLSRIKFLSETIGIKKQQQQPIDEEISSIRNYSHEMIDKMGEIVWALNERNDTLSDLLSYTRAYAVEYLNQNGIRCTVTTPNSFPATFVSGEFRRNVYLTVKEALHNVVKHAQATDVSVMIKSNGELSIEVQDNGIGFDPVSIRAFSNGLTNMRGRIQDLNGKLEIQSENGTTVKLVVPLAP